MRYVLEGEWTGYCSSQQRVVHREVISERRRERLNGLHAIQYTDGTKLLIHIREAKPRERIAEVHSYRELICDAERPDQRPVYAV